MEVRLQTASGDTVVAAIVSVRAAGPGNLLVAVGADSAVSATLPRQLLENVGGSALVLLVAYGSSTGFHGRAAEGGSGDSLEGGSHGETRGHEDSVVFAAPPVSVRLYDMSGKMVSVANLTTPILVALLQSKSENPRARCAYWSQHEGRWSSEGLDDLVTDNGTLVCASSHLTLFGAIRQMDMELACTNVGVLSLAGLSAAGNGWWAARAPGILLWVLLTSCVGLIVWASSKDQEFKRMNIWKDEFFLTFLPKTRTKRPWSARLCNRRHGRRAESPCRMFLKHSPKRKSRILPYDSSSDNEETFGDRVAARLWRHAVVKCVQSQLAVLSGLTAHAVAAHVWGSGGFVQNDFAVGSSKGFAALVSTVKAQVSGTCDSMFVPTTRTPWCAFSHSWLIFKAQHPVVDLRRLDTSMSGAKRAKLFSDSLLGALVCSALFFSVSGEALHFNSPADCPRDHVSFTRFVAVGVVSSLVVRLPLAIVTFASAREYVDLSRWGLDTKRLQLRRWRAHDFVFWTVGVGYASVCILFLICFTSNLHSADEWKWVVALLTVLLNKVLLGPLLFTAWLSAAAALARLVSQEVICHGLIRLGVARDVAPPHPKVAELAERGIEIQDLLDFYDSLGTRHVMPHFDPDKSTTHDVVRQAVIPLSRSECGKDGVAYATLASQGQPRLAERMVTHNWANLFAHLLAAVLADCLGEGSYGHRVEDLSSVEHRAVLRGRLQHKLHRTYWICAFSVNQHAGICATPPPTDSHGVTIRKCPCKVRKQLTGDACEMNKFDDMMQYLAMMSPGFAQVIAVDAKFSMFTRIWCVAELAEARRSFLPQFLKVHSKSSLDEHLTELQSLDVRSAEASMPADRDLVLAKIRDPDKFNSQLRDLVLNPKSGLVALWSSARLYEASLADAANIFTAFSLPGFCE